MSRIAAQQTTTVFVAAVLSLGALQCPKPQPPPAPPPPPPQAPQVSGNRPECPADYILIPRGGSLIRVTTIAGSGPISLIPEFHDCQRLMDSTRTAYGSLIALFARYQLDSVRDPAPGPYQPNTVTFGGTTEAAAATIINYDQAYAPLEIKPNFNCLYLFTANGVWRARIFPVNSDSDCLKKYTTMSSGPFSTQGRDLNVIASPVPVGQLPPPVARWDWDPEAKEHYIGIRCGTRWCEVYSGRHSKLKSSAKYTGSSVVSIKGWYDEQYLAVKGPMGGPDLVPSKVMATIFPVPGLEFIPVGTFKQWTKVAMVSLSGDSPEYLSKFNFVKGPAPLANSEVWLCNRSRIECGIPSTSPIAPCDQTNGPWWAKIVSGTATVYHCVILRTHPPGFEMPGAARWRWKNNDEGMWVRCPAGCCEVT